LCLFSLVILLIAVHHTPHFESLLIALRYSSSFLSNHFTSLKSNRFSSLLFIPLSGMDVQTAISTAKKCRPIIDPIGQLPDFLHRLKRATDKLRSGETESAASAATAAAEEK
jgi:hypothetical protein